MGHPGRPARLDGAAPRSRTPPGWRSTTDTRAGAPPAPSGSTPTPGSTCSGETVADATGMPFADYLHEAVCVPLGHDRDHAARLPRPPTASPPRPTWPGSPPSCRPRRCSTRARVADAVEVAFPGLDGHPARLRPAAPQRLGAGLRDPRRQVAALDRREQLAADVRALRAVRHVPLGRPGRPARRRRADRPRLRAVGQGGLAAVDRRVLAAL